MRAQRYPGQGHPAFVGQGHQGMARGRSATRRADLYTNTYQRPSRGSQPLGGSPYSPRQDMRDPLSGIDGPARGQSQQGHKEPYVLMRRCQSVEDQGYGQTKAGQGLNPPIPTGWHLPSQGTPPTKNRVTQPPFEIYQSMEHSKKAVLPQKEKLNDIASVKENVYHNEILNSQNTIQRFKEMSKHNNNDLISGNGYSTEESRNQTCDEHMYELSDTEPDTTEPETSVATIDTSCLEDEMYADVATLQSDSVLSDKDDETVI